MYGKIKQITDTTHEDYIRNIRMHKGDFLLKQKNLYLYVKFCTWPVSQKKLFR